jgi:hypothetical protein
MGAVPVQDIGTKPLSAGECEADSTLAFLFSGNSGTWAGNTVENEKVSKSLKEWMNNNKLEQKGLRSTRSECLKRALSGMSVGTHQNV